MSGAASIAYHEQPRRFAGYEDVNDANGRENSTVVDVTSILRCPITKMELVFHNADCAKLLHEQIIKDEPTSGWDAGKRACFDAFLCPTDGRLSYPISDVLPATT